MIVTLPRDGALPNANTVPSAAATQYPAPNADDAMPTTGDFSKPTGEPQKWAAPKLKMPPSAATSQ